jgi:WD40 repeat protein
MARVNSAAEQSDFEKQRLANIAERDALLKKVTQEARQAGLFTRPASKPSTNGTSKIKKKPAPRVKKEEDFGPRRTSSRLQGIQADSEVAKRKAEDDYEQQKEVARIKQQRISGDLNFGDIAVNGTLLGTDTLLKGVAEPYKRTFGDDEIRHTTDKDLKKLREKMNGLELWDAWEPHRIKITPERIYSMSFHPTTSKPLVFAGDKLGNLGIVDASQPGPQVKANGVKEEGDEDQEDDNPDPVITTIKPHARTISAMHTHPSHPQTLYTSSYDSSIRAIDLEKSIATEVYGPSDHGADEPISGVDMSADNPNILYFTTLNGAFGRHDTREKAGNTELYQLSEKKIGGFSLHPLVPHFLATASLDRTMKLWDLRKITKKLPTLVGEHESRLSVSHASFNSAGQVATSSYDDSIKIHSFGVSSKTGTESLESMMSWKAGYQLDQEVMKPEVVIRHNNQTGRWVTMYARSNLFH